MQAALTMKFSKSKETNTTISKIHDHLASIFGAGVAPTQDEWFIGLILNTLDGTEYDWLQKNMLTQFTNMKITPTSKDVVNAINFACYNDHQESSKDLVKVFKTSGAPRMKGKSKATCSNCGMCHDISECWSEGTRACGKAPEWWKVKQAEKSKADAKKANKKPKNKGKDKVNAATHNDSNDSCVKSVIQ